MVFRDIALGLVFNDLPVEESALKYATSFAGMSNGRLSALLCVPVLDMPSARVIPNLRAIVTEHNEQCGARAKSMAQRLVDGINIQPFDVDVRVLQRKHAGLIADFVASARLCDICVLSRPPAEYSFARDLVEAALFESGRPIVITPPNHDEAVACRRIVVAWDGGARAARAVGDAMRLLEGAEQVDIVCVSEQSEKSLDGADLAAHLGRRCKSVDLVELSPEGANIGDTIRGYARKVDADLIVMGAFAHARIMEILLGGTTNDMILHADTPVFMSY